MRRAILISALLGAALGDISAHVAPSVHAAGNSDAAHACQQGGYATLQGTDGTHFTDAGQCTSYAARGGTIMGIPMCAVLAGTSGCVTLDNLSLPYNTDVTTPDPSLGTITLSGVYSFSPSTCLSAGCTGAAVGGGTYSVSGGTFNGGTAGTFQVTSTSNDSFSDQSTIQFGSCASAYWQDVEVAVTFTDAKTAATSSGYVRTQFGNSSPALAMTGTLVAPSDSYMQVNPSPGSISLAC